MLTLLVKRRDELQLGNLIPVGDLWDEIASGDQPFSEGMRIQFDNAKKLWNQKLQPLLEQEHQVTWQDLQEGRAEPQVKRRLQNDARLLKTLLLAALVPEVPALRALTALRLAALNHGSVVSPVPGGEGGIVLQSAGVGEPRRRNPGQRGPVADHFVANHGRRRRTDPRRRIYMRTPWESAQQVQRILFDMLGIVSDSSLLATQPFYPYQYLWRGTRRRSISISRLFANSPTSGCAVAARLW